MSEASAASTTAGKSRLALHWQIVIGLILGAVVGLAANALASVETGGPLDADQNGIHDRLDWWMTNVTDPVGKVFLRLIFMVVIPLVFSALALAVVGIGSLRELGSVGLRTLGYTLMLSLSAVLIGVVLVNALRPGDMLPEEQRDRLKSQYARGAEETVANARKAKPLRDVLLDIIPENPLQEMVGAMDASSKGNGMLAVMFFALAMGVAMTFVREQSQTLIGWLEGLNAVSMAIIGFAMRLAPLGVACLVFGVTGRLGLSIVPPLAGFLVAVLTGYVIHLVGVYSLVLVIFGRRSPLAFFRAISEAMLTAFGTSSSNATLPTSLRVAEERLGLRPESARFVLTIGATGNQNGTALYEGVVVLFLAQVFHVELTLVQQIQVVLMAVLAGVGTAGVPGGSLPMIVVVMQSVGVPAEGIGIILGIDRILDMCRSVLNVTGDLTIAACVERSATTYSAQNSRTPRH